MTENKTYKIIKEEELNKGEVEFEIEISEEVISKHREDSIKELGKDVEVPGFRKGQAPEKTIIETVGEMAILEKSTYKAINNIVPLLLTQEKIDALDQPSISVTKLAPKSSVTFKMKLTLMPQVELPNYKEIAKTVEKTKKQDVTDKEVDEYIDYIRTQRAQAIANSKKEKFDPKNPNLPELNNEFIKTLGNFKDVDDFKKQLKENMLTEKNAKEEQRRRLEIIEKIIDDSKIDLPEVLIEQELERMAGKFRHDIENMKMNFDDYLKEIKKTVEDLKKEWKVDAEKRVKMNMVLPKIAEEEKLSPNPDIVKKEVDHLKEHHKDIDETHATMYVSNILLNEEVFKFLEELK